MNLTNHALIGDYLTDRRIDHYALAGNYGEARREAMIVAVCRGQYGHLREGIQSGKYGHDVAKRYADTADQRRARGGRSRQPLTLLSDFC